MGYTLKEGAAPVGFWPAPLSFPGKRGRRAGPGEDRKGFLRMTAQIAQQEIEAKRPLLEALSMEIWNKPEAGFKEFSASERTAQLLREEGFAVEMGVGGVPTAIRASWGSGHPVLGFLGEYDALPGMSQQAITRKEPVCPGGYGQGCGHNLLGVAHVGAVIGLKKEMQEKHLPGTVVYYGCPGEELLTGKPFMARGGAFRDLDAAIAFHPGRVNEAVTGVMTGLNSVKFHFKGVTAHAGGDPYNGRSALDAVELTNVGANYLREHVKGDVRIHYVITEGGVAPNIVPDRACVWYYVRALRRENVEDVYRRLLLIAQGAATMTETQLEVEFMGGCYPTLNNRVLAGVIDEALRETPRPTYTQEELDFARALNETMPEQWQTIRDQLGCDETVQIHNEVAPPNAANGYGSTDVGDVAHIVPTATFNAACYNLAAPGHSWQITACSGMGIGQKGMLYAAKAMAAFGLKLLEDPKLLQQAREEFEKSTAGHPYVCPIPAEVPVP